MKFLKIFLFTNPVKIISLTLLGFLFYLSYSMNKTNVSTIKPVYSFKINNHYYHTYFENNSPITFISSQPPNKDGIILKKLNELKYFFMIFTSVSFLLLFIASFCNDNDFNWEIHKVIAKYRISKIECTIEDSFFIYTYRGKLLTKTTYRIDDNYAELLLYEFLKNPSLFPNYETKKQRRRSILKDI